MVRVLIVGYGYWGPNLVRNVVQCPHTEAVGVCDRDPARRARAQQNFPSIPHYKDLEEALHAGCDAVIIATPASTHFPLALRCLDAGKHLLIEKPLASSAVQGRELVARAAKANRILMVDHTFIYSQAVRQIKRIIDNGDLGDLYYVDCTRINMGLVQRDINVIWDLAPHDFSIIDHLVGGLPQKVTAMGKAHINDKEDVANVTLDYNERLMASVHLNWLSPVKIRQLLVGGAKRSLIYNDLEPIEKIRIYNRQIECLPDPEDKHRVLFEYRLGDMHSPYIPADEPLQSVIRHFADCIEKNITPITDGQAGLRVVEMLEACDRSLAAEGRAVPLTDRPVETFRKAA